MRTIVEREIKKGWGWGCCVSPSW